MNALALMYRQHRKIEGLLQRVKNDGYQREQRLSELIEELSAHLVVETHLLHSTMHTAARATVRETRAIDRRTRSVIDELASTRGGAAFHEKATELETLFSRHTVLTDRTLLPAFARSVSDDALREIGEDMARLSFALVGRGRNYRGR